MTSSVIASTPEPPYFAVIFTSLRSGQNDDEYSVMSDRMTQLASEQQGFLGIESTRDEHGSGITVSYWSDHDSIRQWYEVLEHRDAQQQGRRQWYSDYRVRVAHVQRDYGFDSHSQDPRQNRSKENAEGAA